MQYEFRDPTGKVFTHEFDAADAPSIGEFVAIGGMMCRRIASKPQLSVVAIGARDANIKTFSILPEGDLPPEQEALLDGRDEDGAACFSSRDRAEKFARTSTANMLKGEGPGLAFGDGPSGTEVGQAEMRKERIAFDG